MYTLSRCSEKRRIKYTIKDLAETVAQVVVYTGEIEWDTTKPDGTLRKLMDSTKPYNMGWHPSIALREGIERTYEEFKATL